MARQKRIILSGRIANLIFYEYKGIPCARTVPEKVRQTKATKASALQFGLITRISKDLRASLYGFVPNSKDLAFMHKVNSQVRDWLNNRKGKKARKNAGLPLVNWIEYNEDSLLENRCPLKLEMDWSVEGKVRITIPAVNPRQQLSAPQGTHTIHYRFALGGCEVAKEKPVKQKMVQVELPYRNEIIPAQTVTLPANFNSDTLAILAMDINYEKAQKAKEVSIISQRLMIADKAWTPCAVIGSYYY